MRFRRTVGCFAVVYILMLPATGAGRELLVDLAGPGSLAAEAPAGEYRLVIRNLKPPRGLYNIVVAGRPAQQPPLNLPPSGTQLALDEACTRLQVATRALENAENESQVPHLRADVERLLRGDVPQNVEQLDLK